MKKSEIVIKKWTLDECQGSAFLLNSAPEGYLVKQIIRNKNKAIVTYRKIR